MYQREGHFAIIFIYTVKPLVIVNVNVNYYIALHALPSAKTSEAVNVNIIYRCKSFEATGVVNVNIKG